MSLDQCLCPPGEGVYTVHTAQHLRSQLQEKIYQTIEPREVFNRWKKSLSHIQENELPFLLGIPSDSGAGIIRGSNWGPLFLREKFLELKPNQYFDLGDVRVIPHFTHDSILNDRTIAQCREALYDNPDSPLPVSALSITEYALSLLYQKSPSAHVFSLGGDHSISYPCVKTWAKNQKSLGHKYGLIHFDAHTDLLKERLGVDLCFGSWTSHIIKEFEKPSHIIQLGIRSSAKERSHWEKSFGLTQIWSQEILRIGAMQTIEPIIESLKNEKITHLYISFDIDCLDTQYASATGTPEPNGLDPYDCVSIIRALRNSFMITGVDLVEVAPFIQHLEYNQNPEPQTTLLSAQIIGQTLLEALA